MAGEIATHLLADRFDDAKAVAAWYAEVFKDRYFLEVQSHAAGEQRKLNAEVFKLAKSVGLPVVATNDSHFLRAEDHEAHDILLCIGLKKDRLDADRMRYDNGLYFKSAPEVREFFPDRPDVLENTLRVADMVNVEFSKKYHVPAFPLPKGVKSENALLVKLATEGATRRYGTPLPADVKALLDQFQKDRAALVAQLKTATDAQRQQIRSIQQQRAPQLRTLQGKVAEAREAQRRASVAVPLDEQAIRTAARDMATAQADLSVERARVYNEVFAVLTPDQQDRVRMLQAQAELARQAMQTFLPGIGEIRRVQQLLEGNVPLGAGLSSSASLEVAIGTSSRS